jgi:hypothetical protein
MKEVNFFFSNITVLNVVIDKNITELDDDGNGKCENE